MRVSIASPLVQPSPNGRRVVIRIDTFEACSGFTHVTARRIAQPPKVTFVARPTHQLPSETARQLPDLSTIIRVRSSLTDGSRPRGALPEAVVSRREMPASASAGSDCSMLIVQEGSYSLSAIAAASRAFVGLALRDRLIVMSWYWEAV